MGKTQIKVNSKLLNIVLGLTIIGISIFGYFRFQDYESTISWLKSDIANLENAVDELENDNEVLQVELSETKEQKSKFTNLYNEYYKKYNEVLDSRDRYGNYYTNYYSQTSAAIETDLSLTKTYFDGASIIEPDFSSIHNLMQMSTSEFVETMKKNNYVLTTDGDSYIANDTRKVYCTIQKEWNNVTMIITDYYSTTKIDNFFSSNNISYKYDDGMKVYEYRYGSSDFKLYIKNSNDVFLLILKYS